ncbi:MAG: NADH-quinone oxidoreductase subunit NuoE [Chloroflexota bacterium]|jgi:NADH:ubiquinone oxidoreductase subunit E
MSDVTKSRDKVMEVVQTAIERHGTNREELIPILNEINRELGYLPGEAMEEISRRLHEPKSSLFGVASFYHMLSTKPRGRHVIQFCESAPCHVVGGREVFEALMEELGLRPDETTPDGKWTLITTSCLGVCSVGPVVVIDEDIYGNVDAKKIPEILARYQ